MRKRLYRAVHRRTGLTLVEVVVGLVLMASLAVGTLLAYGSHQRQIQSASERMEATEIADQLFSTWYSAGRTVPRGATGQLQVAADRWIWQTRIVQQQQIGSLPVEVIQLRLSRLTPRGQRFISSIDVLAPVPEPGTPSS